MIITFKSNASGDVVMLEDNGKAILRVLGRDFNDTKGVLTVEQLPDAISAVKNAIRGDKAQRREWEPGSKDDTVDDAPEPVLLFQRALPVLEMLERSLKKNEHVTWGI